jgi:hypothetical protein
MLSLPAKSANQNRFRKIVTSCNENPLNVVASDPADTWRWLKEKKSQGWFRIFFCSHNWRYFNTAFHTYTLSDTLFAKLPNEERKNRTEMTSHSRDENYRRMCTQKISNFFCFSLSWSFVLMQWNLIRNLADPQRKRLETNKKKVWLANDLQMCEETPTSLRRTCNR